MMDFKEYLQYEQQVLKLLIDKISNENNGNTIKTEYRFLIGNRQLRFDLVELNHQGKLVKVYEIKTQSAIRRNYRYVNYQLQLYQKATGAEVYLVYIGDDKEIHTQRFLESENHIIKEYDKSQNDLKVESFSCFYTKLKQICNNEGNELNFFFRGHSDYKYEPIPSIYRNDNFKYENRFYREAIRRDPTEFPEEMSTFDKLVKMQHYELPTRLLDITTNPLIALFFACQENENVDGAVLVYSMLPEQIKYYDSDSVCILSNLAKCQAGFVFTNNKESLVYDIQQDKPNFKGKYLESDAVKKVLCVMPKLNNERIIRQQGAFFIFGMGTNKDIPAKILDQPTKIIIKADAKKNILKELELLGIDEASLFPETDKVMKQIKLQFCD
ncbi:MAG: FRG domain-containing protein [Bacteroidales bacterium]|nr:FRG domain-containing protein [Bacteroidales bacterium]